MSPANQAFSPAFSRASFCSSLFPVCPFATPPLCHSASIFPPLYLHALANTFLCKPLQFTYIPKIPGYGGVGRHYVALSSRPSAICPPPASDFRPLTSGLQSQARIDASTRSRIQANDLRKPAAGSCWLNLRFSQSGDG